MSWRQCANTDRALLPSLSAPCRKETFIPPVKIFHSLDDFPPALHGAAVAIGNFDGVHRGHARLIERLMAMACITGGPAVVFTFDPHPVSILRPDAAPMPLIWTERKIEILGELGVDAAIAYPTTREFLELDARQFFDRIVREKLQAKAMVEGPNFFFGHNRSGNVEVLQHFCEEAGLPFEVTAPFEIGGQAVSSSRVRKLLLEGRAAEAAQMLGRPYRIRGMVVRGAGRGAKLGFPTANVEQVDTLLPPDGIYAGKAWVEKTPREGEAPAEPYESPRSLISPAARREPRPPKITESFPAAISLGTNPTFNEQAMNVE